MWSMNNIFIRFTNFAAAKPVSFHNFLNKRKNNAIRIFDGCTRSFCLKSTEAVTGSVLIKGCS